MQDLRVLLKVKIKSLAAEALIIRHEERRSNLRAVLQSHRSHVVRPESRAAQLAYAYARGKSYESVENNSFRQPNWDSVRRLAKRYGGVLSSNDLAALDAWISSAEKSIKLNADKREDLRLESRKEKVS